MGSREVQGQVREGDNQTGSQHRGARLHVRPETQSLKLGRAFDWTFSTSYCILTNRYPPQPDVCICAAPLQHSR